MLRRLRNCRCYYYYIHFFSFWCSSIGVGKLHCALLSSLVIEFRVMCTVLSSAAQDNVCECENVLKSKDLNQT